METPKNILLYCVLDKQGGIETHIQSLARILKNAGANVTVAAKWVKAPEYYEAYFKNIGVRLVYSDYAHWVSNLKLPPPIFSLLVNLIAIITFRAKLKPRSFDLVSINATGFFGERLLHFLKPISGRVAYHEHLTLSHSAHLSSAYVEMLNRMNIVTLNSTIDFNVATSFIKDKKKLSILPALASLCSVPDSLVFKNNEGPFNVGFIGNLAAKQKGAHKLINIWLNNNIQDMQLTLYGPNSHVLGDLSKHPMLRIAGAYLPKNISKVFQEIDLLVHPADNESLGLVLIEAMAHGVPFLATHVGGIIDIADGNPNVMTVANVEKEIYQGILEMRKRIKSGAINAHEIRHQYDAKWSAKALGAKWVDCYLGNQLQMDLNIVSKK